MPVFTKKRLFLLLFAVLIGLRLALAPFLTRYVNSILSRHADYRGEVGDIDINLWRGAYEIEDLALLKRSGDLLEPFLSVDRIDLSIQWSALLHGAVVGEITFFEPRMNFVLAPDEAQSQTGIDRGWQQTLLDLFPFKIDQIDIRNGAIRFQDLRHAPVVDVDLRAVQARARNLTNVRPPETSPDEDELVATLEAVGQPLGHGELWLRLRLDPFASEPTFDLDAGLQGLDLVRMNDFLRAYANLDVERGTFDLFTEFAASQGRVHGYIKPFLHDVDVVSFREVTDPAAALQALWEAIAGASAQVLKNDTEGKVATRIPFEGRIEDPKADIASTIWNLLKNAFLRALTPGVEDSVALADAEAKQDETEKRERLEQERRHAQLRSGAARAPDTRWRER